MTEQQKAALLSILGDYTTYRCLFSLASIDEKDDAERQKMNSLSAINDACECAVLRVLEVLNINADDTIRQYRYDALKKYREENY